MDRYEQALERARFEVMAHPECRKIWEDVFPELAESEDERIRKELIEFLREAYSRGNAPEECAKWLVYLDKPKEQNCDTCPNRGNTHSYLKGYEDARKEQKPTEWSEEDKRALNDAIVALSEYANGEMPHILPSILLEDVERLKSLRPRPHWKPSEEQIEALKEAVYQLDGSEYSNGIDSLYNDLSKLI